MTVPKGFSATMGRVSDMVREAFPRMRPTRLTEDERVVGIYLRSNDNLLEGLRNVIESRIRSRGNLPVPSDPVVCKAILERDRELQWLISRLEFIHGSPALQEEEQQREQPA